MRHTLGAFAVLLTGLVAWAAPTMFRPAKEYRTINTGQYEIVIHKNGRLSVKFQSGDAVLTNACPMVWLDGEDGPRALPVDGRWSMREEVNDRLGQGQGMVLKKKECEWSVRSYTTRPYLCAQVAYVNTSKAAVRVRMLSPWTAEGAALSLGPGTAQSAILSNSDAFPDTDTEPKLVRGDTESLWDLAVFNPTSGQSFVAGFLTTRRAYGRLAVERGGGASDGAFSVFRADCVYDPPVEVPPGEGLLSEVLYLSVAESNPFEALERFGAAMAAANQVRRTRPFLPHGWDSWNTKYKDDINEARMLEALEFVDTHLKRYGWNHFAIDDGWQLAKGNWEPNPERFPHGMKWMADQIHARGMTAGLWLDPFTVAADSPLAKEHPEWLVAPSAQAREEIGADLRILDVTAPGAAEYVRNLAAKIGTEWGYDALMEADFVYNLLYAEMYADKSLTRVEVLHKGMQALRDGFGPGKFILGTAPLPVTGLHVDGMRIGEDCAPLWRKAPDKWPWGCVDSLTNAAHRYYFAPFLWATDQDCAYFGHAATRQRWQVADQPELSWDQSIAWLTGAALTGGIVKIGDYFPDLSEREATALTRLLPVLERPARPVDLFERDAPQVWSVPIKCAIGQWQIVAVFNWDAASPQTVPVEFARLGLDPEKRYTVYGFWEDAYYGLAHGKLDVGVPPGAVRLLGLRPYADHPMFLATDRHFSQGATDFTALEWNPQEKRLRGAFTGVANTDYNLRVLVPNPYKVSSVTVSAGPVQTAQDGPVLKIAFRCADAGPVEWTVSF